MIFSITQYNTKLLIVTLVAFLLWSSSVTAQSREQSVGLETVSVTLEVLDGLLGPGDHPAIRGDFPSGQNPEGVALTQIGQNMWEGTIRVPLQKKEFSYEYVIVRETGAIEPEGYNGRTLIALQDGAFAPMEDFLRAGGPLSTKEIEVEIILDISELPGSENNIQQVGLAGLYGGLNWTFPEGLRLLEPVDEVWKTTVTFPAGTPMDIPFKFAWKIDDVWDFEPLPYYKTHLLFLNMEASEYVLHIRFDNQNYRLAPQTVSGMEVDNYRKLAELFQGSRDYHFHLAMHLLKQGDPGGADISYETFKSYFPELDAGTHKNFYFTDKIESMGRDGLGDLALSIVEEKLAVEVDSFQTSYYLYLKGWLLRELDRLEESKQVLQQSVDFANDEDAYHSQKQYARLGLAMTYLADPDPDEQEKARELLLEFTTTHTNPNLRRDGWEKIAHVTRKDRDKTLHKQALRSLQETGSPKQRAKSRIRWAEYQLEYGEPDSADAVITQLEQEVSDETFTDDIQLLRASYLLHIGEKEQARGLLQAIENRQGNASNSAAVKARQLLRTRAKQGGQ